ncbi:hypothetical protein PLESTB_000372400 [Pleodorina starrii]|uniref:AAA+ ATPase domain-containing protein n=1 Tax=Pleodorina starrii TaxID=330485 RepID=A0A9W6BF47_9CHLO|nr:hypothetical protein PLESTM_000022500 [Pleodorina starrii]GLC50376.1 hypothetical protein PLESTB_000372400 [Pleodorina starrii]GLC64243.1 hypothetical protein PLESTF_000140300 [Pleodorina starrii]
MADDSEHQPRGKPLGDQAAAAPAAPAPARESSPLEEEDTVRALAALSLDVSAATPPQTEAAAATSSSSSFDPQAPLEAPATTAAAAPPPPPPPPPALSAAARVAGMTAALQAVRELISWPALYGAEGAALGVRWPRGLLLHGPPGCGKTLLVQAVAAEAGARLHVVTAARVTGAYTGESERRLREAFAEAQADADAGRVAVVFLDEVDALCPRRDGGRAHDSRVVAQLLTLLDGAATGGGGSAAAATAAGGRGRQAAATPAPAVVGHLVVVGATNRPNALDPALRRPGRLDREVLVALPDAEQRREILGLHTRGLHLAPDVDLAEVAASCHGYSGADLAATAREAAMAALAEVAAEAYGIGAAAATAAASASAAPPPPPPAVLTVRQEHLAAALRKVRPSIMRGAEVDIPPVSWDDVGGLEDVKRRLRQAVEWPLRHAAAFERLGLAAPRGVLLHGPPGCSKTTLARAAATASGATFLALSCAQLFSMYVGEGEAALRDAFKRARMAAPAVLFLDELDAVAGRREEGGGGNGGGGGPDSGVRLLTTLLTEMDGIELATGVLVLGATNRPGGVDPALLRPGRFSTLLLVPPPDEAGRLAALRVHCRRMPLGTDVDLPGVAARTDMYTGAELAAVCREAALAALREDLEGASQVEARHFEAALRAVRPAMSAAELEAYAAWGRGGGGRGGGGGGEEAVGASGA